MRHQTTRHRITRRAIAVVLAAAIATAGVVAAIAATGGGSASSTSIGLRALGNASIGNSKQGQAIFTTPPNLKPGGSASATIEITNTADPSTLSVSKSNLKDVKGAISDDLQLQVVDKTNSKTIYTGSLTAFASGGPITLTPDWPNSQKRTYEFTVSLPHTVGNADQGAVTTVDFNWNATALELPDTGGGGGGGGTDTGGGGGVTTQPVDTGTTNPGGGTFTGSGGTGGGVPNLNLGGASTQKTTDFVTFFATCDQVCSLTVGGTVNVPGGARVYRLSKATKVLRAGVKTKVTVRFPTKVRNAVRKAVRRRKTVTVALSLGTKNAAGASRTSSRRIRIHK